MTIEELKSGSEFHSVQLLGRVVSFQIFATGTSEEHIQRFHEIVEEAETQLAGGVQG